MASRYDVETKFKYTQAGRRRILKRLALEGERGRFWYQRACRELSLTAKTWGLTPEYVAVAMAATSPLTPVISSPRMARGGGSGSNIGKARRVLKRQARAARGEFVGSSVLNPKSPGASRLIAYEDFRRKGYSPSDALAKAFPTPDVVKTHAFVRNLLGELRWVTVDTLIARGAGLKPVRRRDKKTKKMVWVYDVSDAVYKALVADIRAVAKQLGWAPAEVMAAAWTALGGTGEFNLSTYREGKRRPLFVFSRC